MHLSEQEIVRRQAREELEKLGIDPYPAHLYERTHQTAEIRDGFNEENSKDFWLGKAAMNRNQGNQRRQGNQRYLLSNGIWCMQYIFVLFVIIDFFDFF